MDEPALTEKEFHQFRQLIYRLTGISLSDAKRLLVQSRLQRRLRHHCLTRFQEYYDLVAAQGDDSPEITELVNCITTNKTSFFREPHHFDFVAKQWLPALCRQAAQGRVPRRLRIWHAGCSTGEEPYTLAMTLADALEGQGQWDVRQLASDIDTNVLAYAERGVYDEERVESVPAACLRKYFLRGKGAQAGHYRVCRALREQITFRRINLLSDDWPFRADTRFDLIFCRNVVIYFDKPTRQKLFARYAQHLKPGGYLFIGHSESLIGISDAFDSLGKTIYQLPETHRQREALAA